MTNVEEIKKRLDEVECFSALTKDHDNFDWLITQLRASLEREECLAEGVNHFAEQRALLMQERDVWHERCGREQNLFDELRLERDDYREVLEKFTEDYTSMNKRQEAKDVLDKYPKASK